MYRFVSNLIQPMVMMVDIEYPVTLLYFLSEKSISPHSNSLGVDMYQGRHSERQKIPICGLVKH